MATQYAFGKIVTNGLVLALDAADRNSYVSGSTTWNSLLGTYSGSLVQSCSFNPGPPQTFINNINSFQSQSAYLSLNEIQFFDQSTYTLDFWIKMRTGGGVDNLNSLVGWGSTNPWLALRPLTDGSSWYITFRDQSGTYNDFSSITDYNVSKWTNITLTTDTSRNVNLYVNGTFRETKNISSTFIRISRIMGGYSSGFNFYNLQGSMASAKFYNTTLSSTEILQNYNAQKTRFGLV